MREESEEDLFVEPTCLCVACLRAARLSACGHAQAGKQARRQVHVYTREEAIADGTLVQVGALVRVETSESVTICFTAALYADLPDPRERDALIREGIQALTQPDPEDSSTMKLRVLRGEYWAILDGDGLTLLYPSDY